MVVIGLLFFILASICEAIMDILQFHYITSPFKKFKNNVFWDPEVSWRNKYKDGDPNKGPRFIGSDTIFVGLTDAWHLFKMFRTLFIFLGVLFLLLQFSTFWISIIVTALLRIFFGIGFTIFYEGLKK